MGFKDWYLDRLKDDLKHGVGDGLKAAFTGDSVSRVKAERQSVGRKALDSLPIFSVNRPSVLIAENPRRFRV